MSMSTFPNRTQIDQAAPLAFEREPTITIRAQLDGWQVDVAYHGRLEQLPAALKRLTAAGLTPACPTAAQEAPPRIKRGKVEPIYTPAGEPCCPTHTRPLKEGKFGWFCSAKDDRPDSRNGYCGLKFEV